MQKTRCTSANLTSIGLVGQKRLASSQIAIAGLGGVGGIAFELLVRAGIGKIKIADAGFFEESNANRQSLWSKATDGVPKTKAALSFAASVNYAGKITCFGEITPKNARAFASGCAAVIDATDKPHSRISVWRGCKKAGVPYIFASALHAQGMLTVFKNRDFEKEFGLQGRQHGNFSTCDNALGPASNAIGCLAVAQAMNLVLQKPAVLFPHVLSLDLFSKKPVSVHEF